MKIPFFLRLPVLWAVGDSSVGSPPSHKHKKPASTDEARMHYAWLLLASAGMVVTLVWAEQGQNWRVAQASLITLLLLLALAVWCWWQEKNPPPELSVAATTYHRALQKLLWCVAIGILALITIAIRTEHWVEGIVARAIGYGMLIAGFSFISGVLLGYLFGLRPTSNSKQPSGPLSNSPPQTNLEEIADWFTKIILGAGLVQLTRMPVPIWKFANAMAMGVVEDPKVEIPNPAIALAIMGFFSASGLLYGYLWTRYEDAVTTENAADASAVALVYRWLNARTAPDDQTLSHMIEAVKNASSTARMRIFLQVEQYRKSSNEDVNERSLPVFEALVDADLQGMFHRNRAQNALALMGRTKEPNKVSDDWSKALGLLNAAIRIRDVSREPGWHEYEFARAVCQIKLDQNFNKEQPSDLQLVQSVQADLDQATDTEVPKATKNLIDKGRVVDKWMALNPKKTP